MALLQGATGFPPVPWSAALLFLWVGALSLFLRRTPFPRRLFASSAFGSVLVLVATPLAATALGLVPMGRCDPFPAHLVMVPAVLLLVSIGSVLLVLLGAGLVRRHLPSRQRR